MARAWSKLGMVFSLFGAVALPLQAAAQEQNFRIGTSVIGELKYKPGFKHFDYVNPDAPEGRRPQAFGERHL
jgi:microcin C transport system substrate-binding protein